MIFNQTGVENAPIDGFIYILSVPEQKERLVIYAGNVVKDAGGADFTYIANAVSLSLQENTSLIKRHAVEVCTTCPSRTVAFYTDPEEARSAINEIVPDSGKRIDDFFNTASERKGESFSLGDYLPKGTETSTEEAKSINPEEEQQA